MDVGIKVSSNGNNVSSEALGERNKTSSHVTAHMLSGIAMAFLYGSEVSLKRYTDAANNAKRDANYVYECLYELSSLMEHLDSVDRYMIMCGVKDPLHTKILGIRNHIRHDLRDNLSDESNKGRTQRAKKLGIDQKLLVHIAFSPKEIKVGTTILKTDEIETFIKAANQIFTTIIKEGIEKGRIKGASLK